jgi:chromosome segregation ATPase
MSGKAKFKYALAPVLLSGQWAHDALLGELADQNSLVAAQERRIDAFTAQLAATTAQWAAVTHAGGALALERLALLGRYGGDQARQLEQARAALVELVARREDLREQVMQSRRRLDAFERHRDQLEQAFVQALASAECKAADDHWNMRKQEKAA